MTKAKTTQPKSRKPLIVIIVVLLLIAAGVGVWWFVLRKPQDSNQSNAGGNHDTTKPIYSKFTGLEITDPAINSAPTFCVQIPNGSTDGARPQVGLNSAGVVFEAIAETGITRFAAIFQNPEAGMIGPIRSLRSYYLEWDTPFDCTIVHDGGSSDALASVGNGNYRNLDEDFNYMWKENYLNGQYRYWNNVFTSPSKLIEFNQTHNYTSSNPQTLPRLLPEQVNEVLASHQPTCDENGENCTNPKTYTAATQIRTAFTNLADYTVNYQYDADNNKYLRFYEGDGAHMSYDCPASNANQFTDACVANQVAPSAILAMMVQENTMSDNYHEHIQTTGSGKAYIFQNGEVITGSWKKSSAKSQLVFTDTEGKEISFTPGQLWIAAVPQFGRVSWE